MQQLLFNFFLIPSALISYDFKTIPINAVQEFWNERPCNLRHSDKLIGTYDYFHEVEKRKYFVEPHIPAFAEFGTLAG